MQHGLAEDTFAESLHRLEQLMAIVRPQFLQDPDIHLALSDHIEAIEAILRLIDRRVEPNVDGLLDCVARILHRAELPSPPIDDHSPSYAIDRARKGIDELTDLTLAAQRAAREAPLFDDDDAMFTTADIVPRAVLRDSWRASMKTRVSNTLQSAANVFETPKAKQIAGFERDILTFAKTGISSAAAWTHFETAKAEFIDLSGLETSTELIDRIAEDLESTVEDLPETEIAALTAEATALRVAAARLSRGAATLRRAHHRHVVQRAFSPIDGAATRRLSAEKLGDLISDWLSTRLIDAQVAGSVSHLDLRFRDIRVLPDLTPFSGLQSLDLSLNPLVEIASLSSATRLRKLNLSVTYTTNLDLVRDIATLEQLALTGLVLTSLRGVDALTKLETLYLNRSSVQNWSALARATSLRALHLRETNFEDLTILADLRLLKTLELRDTKVRDITTLGGASRLRHLDLRNSLVTDIAPLGGLLDLRTLDISDTRVKDVSALAGCPSLVHVDIANSPVETGVQNLKANGVIVST